jgi:hypothetical protein
MYYVILFQEILPETTLPSEQGRSLRATTTIDYNGGFDILSRAARQRLSGIVCTIGIIFDNFSNCKEPLLLA